MVRDIMAACEGLKTEEKRELTDDYGELVVYRSDIEDWTARIATVVGEPAKPAGEKPTGQHNSLTGSFGGIHKDQTLFYKKDGETSVVVMFWPWGDGEHVTIKMARTTAVAAPVQSGGRPSLGKVVKWVLVGVGILVVLLCILLAVKVRRHKALVRATVVEYVDPRSVADGMYEGECDLLLVSARVRVVVAGGRIGSIDVLEHEHGPGYGAEEVVTAIVQAQSVGVDGVSGATASSLSIRKAVEVALKRGVTEETQENAEDGSVDEGSAS